MMPSNWLNKNVCACTYSLGCSEEVDGGWILSLLFLVLALLVTDEDERLVVGPEKTYVATGGGEIHTHNVAQYNTTLWQQESSAKNTCKGILLCILWVMSAHHHHHHCSSLTQRSSYLGDSTVNSQLIMYVVMGVFAKAKILREWSSVVRCWSCCWKSCHC